MSAEEVMRFYEELGFEEIDIEDGLTAISMETDAKRNYILITDDNGMVPENIKKTVILAYYTADGSFLWSASFKNLHQFKEIWAQGESLEQKLSAVQEHRKSKEF